MSSLLLAPRFMPLFATQFLGALNDNIFKNALVVLIAFGALRSTSMSAALMVNLCAALFILPFLLFSASCGRLADHADKAAIARATKLLELAVMSLAGIGFLLHSLPLLLLALFLMGLQSTLFGPVKYALLPQHLHTGELMKGNSWIEAATFVAILLGTVGGGLLAALASEAVIALSCLVIAVVGYLASRYIPPAPSALPNARIGFAHPLHDTLEVLRIARTDTQVWLTLLAISWFWFFGAVFLTLLPIYTRESLNGSETVATLLLALFALGIGAGAFVAARLCHGRPRVGVVLAGALGMSLFAVDLWFASPATASELTLDAATFLAERGSWRLVLDCVLVSACGGLFSLPLYTHLQQRVPLATLGRVIAAVNVMNALYMVLSAAFGAALLSAGADVQTVWLLTGSLNLVMLAVLAMRFRRQRAVTTGG